MTVTVYIYIYDLGDSAALGDCAFLFADDVKVVFRDSNQAASISFTLAWAGEGDLSIKTPSLTFFCSRRQLSDTLVHRRPRPGGYP